MTTVTYVGVLYADHMNDDTPEVNCFYHKCYQALFYPPNFEERAWEQG